MEKKIKRAGGLTTGLKITIGVAVLLIMIAAGVGIVSYLQENSVVQNALETRVPQMTQYSTRIIKDILDQKLFMIGELAVNPDITSKDWNRQQPAMVEAVERLKCICIGYAYANGDVYLNDGASSNILDRDYFINAMKGIPNVSDVIFHKILNIPIMIAATPVFNEFGQPDGVIFMVFEATWLSNLADREATSQ